MKRASDRKPRPPRQRPAPSAAAVDSKLVRSLGPAAVHWRSLVASIIESLPDATLEWKQYKGKSGLQLVIKRAGRNLLYLKPLDHHFFAAMALSDGALEAAAAAGIPKDILEPIRGSPPYREGRAARIQVRSAKDLDVVTRLMTIKAEG